MFLAQILWESNGLQAKEEVNPPKGAYCCPGDTASYHGRGYIQLSWSYNYRAASLGIFSDDLLLQAPELVSEDELIAWKVSFWYWKENVHKVVSAGEGFGATTRCINGALECGKAWKRGGPAEKRFALYCKVLKAMDMDPRSADPSGCKCKGERCKCLCQ